MLRFIGFLLILFGSVWLGLKVTEDPGFALFSYKNWTMEMPLWFAVLSFAVVVFLLYVIIHFADSMDLSFYRFKNWLRWRRKNKAYSKTNRGLLELIEGRWRVAERSLLESVSQSDAPLVNYLGAARAAHQQNDYEKRDQYLRDAHQIAPHSEIAIGLIQAQLQLDQGQLERALATLKHLRSLAPKHPYVLQLLQKLYVRLGDWQELLALLPCLRKAKVLSSEQLDQLQFTAYQQLLCTTAKPENLATIQQIWKAIPKKIQNNPTVVFCYAKQLLSFPDAVEDAEELVHKTVKKSWDENLVKLYGMIQLPSAKTQLAHAENWHKQYGERAVLLLTLGRLCARCQLWGKARDYLEESLRLDANPEVYAEYGKLLEQLGEVDAAVQNYREGLVIATSRNGCLFY